MSEHSMLAGFDKVPLRVVESGAVSSTGVRLRLSLCRDPDNAIDLNIERRDGVWFVETAGALQHEVTFLSHRQVPPH